MPSRTFAIGDIHGETTHLFKLLSCLPELTPEDTLVFLGDYVDRGANSCQVVEYLRKLPGSTPAKVVTLRGNHEDAWLRVIERGWDEFVLPPSNGCLAAYRSYVGGEYPQEGEKPKADEEMMVRTGQFYPDEVVDWFKTLPHWYEDEFAIYVHAGLPRSPEGFFHPSMAPEPLALLWMRDSHFFTSYRGKMVVFGHTRTECLPQELSGYTPEDPTDLWAGENAVGIDTGCGNGGFLTAIELPELRVYESR